MSCGPSRAQRPPALQLVRRSSCGPDPQGTGRGNEQLESAVAPRHLSLTHIISVNPCPALGARIVITPVDHKLHKGRGFDLPSGHPQCPISGCLLNECVNPRSVRWRETEFAYLRKLSPYTRLPREPAAPRSPDGHSLGGFCLTQALGHCPS